MRRTPLRPSLFPIVVSAAALLAFRGQPREVGDVSAHPRFRTVDEETGQKAFVGVKVEASSPDVLLSIVGTLADWVKAARRDASGRARQQEIGTSCTTSS